MTFFPPPHCRYIFRTPSQSTRRVFDSTTNIHLNEKLNIFFHVQCAVYPGECIPLPPGSSRTPKHHKSRLLASHDTRATTREPAAYPVPLSSLSTWRMCIYNRESVFHYHHKARGPPKRHKSRLIASHDARVTTREPAAYPVPLSSLSTRRMCSTTGRVYCSATTKVENHRNVTSPVCLHPMIRR